MTDDNQQTAPAPAAQSAEAEASKKKAGATRSFKARHNVVIDGLTHAAGETIRLTRAEWEALVAAGSVEGGWDG